MKQTLQDLRVKFDEPIPIFCNSTSGISISIHLVMHSKTKHIPSNIILLENKSPKRISSLNMLAQRNKLLTSLPIHYLVKHLIIFAKSLGFSQVFIRLSLLSTRVERGSGGVYRSAGSLFVRGSYPLPLMTKGERRQ